MYMTVPKGFKKIFSTKHMTMHYETKMDLGQQDCIITEK